MSQEEKQTISTFVNQYVSELSGDYKSRIKEAAGEIIDGQSQLTTAWLSMQRNLIGSIGFLSDNEDTTNLLTSFVKSLSADVVEELDGVDLQAEWVSQIDQLTDQQKIQLDKLINGNLTPKQKVALYNQLKENLPDSFDIPIHYVADDAQDLIDRVKASKSRLSKSTNSFGVEEVNPNTLNEINSFFDEMQIDTEEEYNMWLNIASATDDAKEAMDKYRKAVEATSKEKVGIFDQATFAEQISKLDNLQNAYNSFRANVNNNETKINLDISDVESLREDFKDTTNGMYDVLCWMVKAGTEDTAEAAKDMMTSMYDENGKILDNTDNKIFDLASRIEKKLPEIQSQAKTAIQGIETEADVLKEKMVGTNGSEGIMKDINLGAASVEEALGKVTDQTTK